MAGNEKKILMVIAPSNFRDEELFNTKEELEKAGFSVSIASRSPGEIQGMLGGKATAETALSEVNPAEYAGVVFVGGSGASAYFGDATAQELAKKAHSLGRVVAAICIAPSILANAGLLEGKKATAFPSERANLEEKGAAFTGEPVTIDGRIITASGPQAAREFGRAIAKAME
jgi:protease I